MIRQDGSCYLTGASTLVSWRCRLGRGLDGKAETQLSENFQKRTEVWGGFSRFNSCYGGVWKPAELGEISLGKLKIVALFDHCTNNL